ncbi:hypothetical protein DLREEDagr8_33170 [Dongia sp. agr-C8]
MQPRRRAGDAALFDQRVEDPKQIEVKQPELHFAHGTPEHSSFDPVPIGAIWSRGSPPHPSEADPDREQADAE